MKLAAQLIGRDGHADKFADGDLGPDLESPGPSGSAAGSADVIAAEVEQVAELIMIGVQPLDLAGRLEPLHLPLPAPCDWCECSALLLGPLCRRWSIPGATSLFVAM